MPPIKNTICIDFDAVISKYDGWKGTGNFGEPVNGAIEYINKLKLEGWKIIIFTTRGEIDDLINYLDFHNIPYDDINKNKDNPIGTNQGKPFAHVYLDDRALTFKGDWADSYRQIISFKPYYKGED